MLFWFFNGCSPSKRRTERRLGCNKRLSRIGWSSENKQTTGCWTFPSLCVGTIRLQVSEPNSTWASKQDTIVWANIVPLWKRLTVPTLVFFAVSCILKYELDVELGHFGHFGHFIFFHDFCWWHDRPIRQSFCDWRRRRLNANTLECTFRFATIMAEPLVVYGLPASTR